jgi:hypothetical protein
MDGERTVKKLLEGKPEEVRTKKKRKTHIKTDR